VTSEANGAVIINSRITKGKEYSRQKGIVINSFSDTIITWLDEERENDVALSFQDADDTKRML
jgi:hypothetical protein